MKIEKAMGVEQTGEFGWIRKKKKKERGEKEGENEHKRKRERKKGFPLLSKIYGNRAIGFCQSKR